MPNTIFKIKFFFSNNKTNKNGIIKTLNSNKVCWKDCWPMLTMLSFAKQNWTIVEIFLLIICAIRVISLKKDFRIFLVNCLKIKDLKCALGNSCKKKYNYNKKKINRLLEQIVKEVIYIF